VGFFATLLAAKPSPPRLGLIGPAPAVCQNRAGASLQPAIIGVEPVTTAKEPREHVCPQCGSRNIERARTYDPLVRLVMRLLGRRAYRCLECSHGFYDRPRAA
jgi:DNA-directed RNA polymerase subunit RPC12/RpoP